MTLLTKCCSYTEVCHTFNLYQEMIKPYPLVAAGKVAEGVNCKFHLNGSNSFVIIFVTILDMIIFVSIIIHPMHSFY